jgi:hypothetical protein
MNIESLANLSVEVLEAALAKAREREVEAIAALWPKCACGERITQVCYPETTFIYRRLREYGGRAIINCDSREEDSNCPPGDGFDDTMTMWGCCDREPCLSRAWALIPDNRNVEWG